VRSARHLISELEMMISTKGDYEDYAETSQKVNHLWEEAEIK